MHTPRATESDHLGFGFWAVAFAFTVALAFTTITTPLWPLYERRDHFSSLTVTVVFAVYAIGVVASLFLVGHLSDWYGRRKFVIPALVLNAIAGVLFLAWPTVPGLTIARVLCGLGIGAVTPTATAWIAELRSGQRPDSGNRRAEVVSTAANLGGLGLGTLVAGMLAEWVGAPLIVPFLVFIAVQVLALALVLKSPDTRPPTTPRPRYRPQRVCVPAESRARYFAAAASAMVTFAAFGLLTSVAPSFLSGTLHHSSRALAGAVSAAVFIAAVVAQTVSSSRTPQELLTGAIPALVLGLGLLTLAVWLPSPSIATFIAGVLVIGTGAGMMFKGAIGAVSALASDENRAEALAGLFLAAYLGLAGPVIGLGVAMQYLSPRVSLLVFAGALAAAVIAAAPALLGGGVRSGLARLKAKLITS